MTDLKYEAIWPKVFTDPDFEYDADDAEDPLHVGKALADGLSGVEKVILCP